MGCDIHSMLEIFRAADPDSKQPAGWQCVTEPLFKNAFYLPGQAWSREYRNAPLDARNYRLFAMLADVRNGVGFAGVDTGDWVEPISEPKGVPADASLEWLTEVERWDVDMHSHSFLTLAELDAYDWNGVVFERGYVKEAEYLAVRGKNEAPPNGWSGGVWGHSICSMTAAEYEALTAEELDEFRAHGGEAGGPAEIHVQHQWAETRHESMGELAEAMEVMRAYQSTSEATGVADPERIRIVFGFDN